MFRPTAILGRDAIFVPRKKALWNFEWQLKIVNGAPVTTFLETLESRVITGNTTTAIADFPVFSRAVEAQPEWKVINP